MKAVHVTRYGGPEVLAVVDCLGSDPERVLEELAVYLGSLVPYKRRMVCLLFGFTELVPVLRPPGYGYRNVPLTPTASHPTDA